MQSMKKDNRKEVLADTMLVLLENRTFESISVRELTERAGVSRQTFYYYFHDIYEVAEWYFQKESNMILQEFSSIDSWQFGYVLMMKWVQNHRKLVLNCYRSIRKDYVQTFMDRILYQYIHQVVQDQAKGMHVTEDQKRFIAKFFTLAINAISLEWIGEGMKDDPYRIADQVSTLIRGDFQKALQNFEKENMSKKALH